MYYIRKGRHMLIDVNNLEFSYGSTPVLQGVNLHIQAGEVVAILGPNGAGKTTLIENLIGTYAPASGSVRVLGINPREADNTYWSRLGLVQQQWNDHRKWRVCDQLEWVRNAHLNGSSGATAKEPRTVDEALAGVGLADKKHARLGKLSGGQRRRIDFAAATIAHPSLLLLDEPTTGLDPAAKAQIHDLISQEVDAGATVLVTTHDLAEAEKIASRVVILAGGHIIADDTPYGYREKYTHHAEIRWREDGRPQIHSSTTPEDFVRELLGRDDAEITALTVTQPTLEDIYLRMIGEHSSASSKLLSTGAHTTAETSQKESQA